MSRFNKNSIYSYNKNSLRIYNEWNLIYIVYTFNDIKVVLYINKIHSIFK